MDLFEYQARDIFEAHGVPVLRGITATTPEEAAAAAAELGTPGRRRQGAGEDRRPRQGRRRQDRREPRGGRAPGPSEILGLDIKGHVVKTVMVDRGRRHRRGVLLLAAARPRQPPLPGHVLQGGRHGDRAARRRAPRGAGPDPGRPDRRHRPGQGRRDRRRGRLRRRRRRRDRPGPAAARRGVRGRGRHAGRGEPAGQDRATARSSRSTARSPWTRTPTSGTPTTRRWPTSPPRTRWRPRPRPRASTTSSSTARSASSATARVW